MARHVRTGDTVIVTAGDHKGQTGEIMRVDTKRDRVFIKGVNLRTKHMKPTRVNPQGGVITKEGPIHLSNVMLADPQTGEPTRVRFQVLESGQKVRVAVKSGEQIDS